MFFFKNFLEGSSVKVARPRNRGGNEVFKGTAPVFLTAPKEVTLQRKGVEDVSETRQMRKRIKYYTLVHEIPEHLRQEVLRVCPHCSARLYLEGKATSVGDSLTPAPSPLTPAPSQQGGELAFKRQRTATECVQELKDLKALLDSGVLSNDEFINLQERLLRGD